jgi:hypothetical protein
MKTREIKKHKVKLAAITEGLNITKDALPTQRVNKLYQGIQELHSLADVVGACNYYGQALQGIEGILKVVGDEARTITEIDVIKTRLAKCEGIYRELHHNIHYTLQTEEMFNACVSAKWSCVFAAIAAIAACIGIFLTWH